MIFSYKHPSFLMHMHGEIWFCHAYTWISRKQIQFGVTLRMGTLLCLSLQRQIKDSHHSNNWLLKLMKRGQS